MHVTAHSAAMSIAAAHACRGGGGGGGGVTGMLHMFKLVSWAPGAIANRGIMIRSVFCAICACATRYSPTAR